MDTTWPRGRSLAVGIAWTTTISRSSLTICCPSSIRVSFSSSEEWSDVETLRASFLIVEHYSYILLHPHYLSPVDQVCIYSSQAVFLSGASVFSSVFDVTPGLHGSLGCVFRARFDPTFASIIKNPHRVTKYNIQTQTSTMSHPPWILFFKDSMSHNKMLSLRCLMSCKSWLRLEAAKRKLSHHASHTSFNTTDTNHGTSFVSHSLSRVRGK